MRATGGDERESALALVFVLAVDPEHIQLWCLDLFDPSAGWTPHHVKREVQLGIVGVVRRRCTCHVDRTILGFVASVTNQGCLAGVAEA